MHLDGMKWVKRDISKAMASWVRIQFLEGKHEIMMFSTKIPGPRFPFNASYVC